MKKRTIYTAFVSMAFAATLSAQWQEIDTFEDGDVSDWSVTRNAPDTVQVPSTFTAVADPFNAGQGTVLEVYPGVAGSETHNQTAELAIPEALQIADPFPAETKSTLYLKIGRPLIDGAPGEADMAWGLATDSDRPDAGIFSYGNYSVLDRYEKDGIMDIRDGGSFVDLVESALDTNVYYEIWFVIDHSANTYTQYLKGGSQFPEQTMVYENAAYRNETLENLDHVLIITSAGNTSAGTKGKDPLYVDDLYIDVSGENLSTPGGGWQAIDTFEDGDVSNWSVTRNAPDTVQVESTFAATEDPFNAGQGMVLEITPGVAGTETHNQTAELAIPAALQIVDPFPADTKSTLYFKIGRPLVEGAPAEVDLTYGLATDADRPDAGVFSYGNYSPLGRYEKDGIMDIRDGGSYVNLVESALDTAVYYEIWWVIDHAANTYTQYIKGGSQYPQQTMIYENAGYRNETLENLDHILFITSAGNTNDGTKGKDPVYLDDFYIDITGENLTSPSTSSNGGGTTPGSSAGKLINISTRGYVGTGANVLIGGFVIREGAQQVLIQAVGPEFTDILPGALADPTMTVFDSSSTAILTNDDWGDGDPNLVNSIRAEVGATALTSGSKSAAVVTNLAAGAYTVIVSGVGGTEGIALLEVYESD